METLKKLLDKSQINILSITKEIYDFTNGQFCHEYFDNLI